jgi:hypothetical protein
MQQRAFKGLRSVAHEVTVQCSGLSRRLPVLVYLGFPEVQVVQRLCQRRAIQLPVTGLKIPRSQSSAFQVPSLHDLDSNDTSSLFQPRIGVILAAVMGTSIFGNVVYSAPAKRSIAEVEGEEAEEGVVDLTWEMNAALRNAEGCADERLCETTQHGYSSGVKQVQGWLKKMILSEHVDADGNLIAPLLNIVPKHVYANPADPPICPALAHGIKSRWPCGPEASAGEAIQGS